MSLWESAVASMRAGIEDENGSLAHLTSADDMLGATLVQADNANAQLAEAQGTTIAAANTLDTAASIGAQIMAKLEELSGLVTRAQFEVDGASAMATSANKQTESAQSQVGSALNTVDTGGIDSVSEVITHAADKAYDASGHFATATENTPTPESHAYYDNVTDHAGAAATLAGVAEEAACVVGLAAGGSSDIGAAIKGTDALRGKLIGFLATAHDAAEEYTEALSAAVVATDDQASRLAEAASKTEDLRDRTAGILNSNDSLKAEANQVIQAAEERLSTLA